MEVSNTQVINCLTSGIEVHQVYCLTEAEVTTPSGILMNGSSLQIQKNTQGRVKNYVCVENNQLVNGQDVDIFDLQLPASQSLGDQFLSVTYITDYEQDLS